jgi:hypothetical protein
MTIRHGGRVRLRSGFGFLLLASNVGYCPVVLLLLSRLLRWIFLHTTISPVRQDFISFSNGEKETKQRKRLQTLAHKCRPCAVNS